MAKSFCVTRSSSAKPKLDSTTAFGLGSWSTNGTESSSGRVNALPAKSIQRLMPLKASFLALLHAGDDGVGEHGGGVGGLGGHRVTPVLRGSRVGGMRS